MASYMFQNHELNDLSFPSDFKYHTYHTKIIILVRYIFDYSLLLIWKELPLSLLSLVIQKWGKYFHLSIKVCCFSQISLTFLIKFVWTHFIFLVAIINGIVFLNAFFIGLSLVYRNYWLLWYASDPPLSWFVHSFL